MPKILNLTEPNDAGPREGYRHPDPNRDANISLWIVEPDDNDEWGWQLDHTIYLVQHTDNDCGTYADYGRYDDYAKARAMADHIAFVMWGIQ